MLIPKKSGSQSPLRYTQPEIAIEIPTPQTKKLQKENEKLKQEAAKVELSRSATGILAEKGIEATQDVLDFVVGNDADDTNAKIDKLVKIVESQLKKAEIARATGTTPKTMTNSGSQLSEFEKRLAKYK